MKPWTSLAILTWLMLASTLPAQNQDGVPVTGKLTNGENTDLIIDFRELELQLDQEVQLPSLPVPAAILSMSREQRRAWFDSYRESESGQKLIAQRQRLLDTRIVLRTRALENGTFELEHVPPGSYQLLVNAQKELDGKAYTIEVSVEVEVVEGEPIQLGELPLSVMRSLRVGETLPKFEVTSFVDTSQVVRRSDFDRKFILIYFWGLDRELSLIELETLEALREKLAAKSADIDFLGICLNKRHEIDPEFLRYRKLDWQTSCNGQQSMLVHQFGVRSLPHYCLVNPDGKIIVTNALFHKLFQDAGMNLDTIIEQAMNGNDMQKVLDSAVSKGGAEQRK